MKLLQQKKSTLYGFPTVSLNEAPKKLAIHLPTVHGFLVFHTFFSDEDVDDLWVCHGTVTFEPLVGDVAEVCWRDVEGVEGAYFWSLRVHFQHIWPVVDRNVIGGRGW